MFVNEVWWGILWKDSPKFYIRIRRAREKENDKRNKAPNNPFHLSMSGNESNSSFVGRLRQHSFGFCFNSFYIYVIFFSSIPLNVAMSKKWFRWEKKLTRENLENHVFSICMTDLTKYFKLFISSINFYSHLFFLFLRMVVGSPLAPKTNQSNRQTTHTMSVN